MTDTVGERIRNLQAQARELARDHIKALTHHLAAVEMVASEIAGGGDAYPPGIRDVARRLADEAEARCQTIEALMARQA
jgi:predicted transcriptional regulator